MVLLKASASYSSDRVVTNATTYIARMQTLFDIPITLYYFKSEKTFLEKTLKIKVNGIQNGEKTVIGEAKIDVSRLAGSTQSLFDPMMEIIGDNGRPCNVFLSLEIKMTLPAPFQSAPTLTPAPAQLADTPRGSINKKDPSKELSLRDNSKSQSRRDDSVGSMQSRGQWSHNTCGIISHEFRIVARRFIFRDRSETTKSNGTYQTCTSIAKQNKVA